jgi:uncharacterized membrane protein
MMQWSFEPILDSYGIVLLLSGVLVVVLLAVRPWRTAVASSRSRILLALRAAVIALLTLAMLRPAHVSTDSRPQSATLVVLFDQSRSMNVKDSADGESRWQQLQASLKTSQPKLEGLAELFEIRAYGFGDQLGNDVFADGRVELPTSAEGDQTDIAQALSDAIRRESGKRLVGIVLLSDGAQRVLEPKYDLQQSVRELTRLNAPLYTVPFGKPRDQSQARDIVIERLQDQYTMFVNNELDIRGALRVHGYVNQPLPVRVVIDGPEGVADRTLGPIELTATQDDQLVDFNFTYSPTVAGAYSLTVEAAPQDGELVVANNRLTAYLNVLEGGLRVLYLDGNLLSPEQKFVRRSLAASPDIELDFQPIDPRRRELWPIDLAQTLSQTPYDVLLIGDVEAGALGSAGMQQIVDRVQRGLGLMMLGGVNTLGAGGYFDTPLVEVLPVNFAQFDLQPFGPDQPIRLDIHIPGPIQMVPSRPHFITHLAGGDVNENMRLWRSLPPLLGANRFESLKPGEQAVRLAETEDGDPLLVARQYDAGRILVLAVDSTHFWWQHGHQDLHRRFWRQAMLWLANKDDLLRRDVWVRLPRRRFRPGETVAVTAGARGESGEVLSDAELTGTVQKGTAEPRPMGLNRDGDDWSAELESLDQPGEYVVRVTARSNGQEIGDATAKFTVQALDLELSDPAGNPQQLAALARLTADAGGRSLPPEQLAGLLDELLEKPPEMEIEVETKWRFGDSVAETWPFFGVFVTLLGCEWYLRKKWGLN